MWVILRPLGKSAWSGLVRYRNCHESLRPYYTRSGRYYTGLTAENAERLGKILGLELSPNSDYWVEWPGIRVGAKDIYLNTDDPMDELRYLFLKNHKNVAGSIFERKPNARYVLINKEEEAKQSNVFSKLKRRASREFDKLSQEDIRRCLRLFGHNASNMGNEQAENQLFDIVDANPQKFVDLWVDNKNRDTEFIVETAISKNIIRKTKNVYRYGTDIIGHSMDDTVAYLLDPKNQDLKMAIMSEISIKDELFKEKELENVEPAWGEDEPQVEEKSTEKIEKPETKVKQKKVSK